jgi:hypothetical protein
MGKSFKTLSSMNSSHIDNVLERILRMKLIHSYQFSRDFKLVSERFFPADPALTTATKTFTLGVLFEVRVMLSFQMIS